MTLPNQELPLIAVRNLEIGYGNERLLPAFSLEVGPGEFWAVVGRNGCGKTTWLRTVLGLLQPLGGTVTQRAGARISYLPQKGIADELYPVTARDVVAMGCVRGRAFFGPARARSKTVDHAMELMGAKELADASYRELSEGQRQRVLFARVAASQADLALLDEPTSALDLVAEQEAFELIKMLQQASNTSILIVSHYVGLAARFADHAVFLDRDGQQVIVGTADFVFHHSAFNARFGLDLASPRPGTLPGTLL